jgi:hypothetical protein
VSYERNGLARFGHEAHADYARDGLRRNKNDVTELDARAQHRWRDRPPRRPFLCRQLRAGTGINEFDHFGWFLPIGLRVEQSEYALGPRHRRQRLAVLLADGLDRTEKHVREEKELE